PGEQPGDESRARSIVGPRGHSRRLQLRFKYNDFWTLLATEYFDAASFDLRVANHSRFGCTRRAREFYYLCWHKRPCCTSCRSGGDACVQSDAHPGCSIWIRPFPSKCVEG